jgi:ubiquitin C-terminal hydrolase
MGNTCTKKNENQNFDFQESWKYKGAIYQKQLNRYTKEYQTINIESLNGFIYIKKGKINREIKIEGKTKNRKGKDKKTNYIFYGEEINNQINDNNDYNIDEKIIFKIKGENKFQFNDITIIKYINESTKACGDNIYTINENGRGGPYFLDLHLSNHVEYNKQLNYEKINTCNLELSKLLIQNNPEDILINSLCGMKNLINTCYINSSFQILIHIPEFIKIMRNNSYFEYDNIIKQINNIYDQILEKYKQYKSIINPKSFVNYFKANHYTYNNYSQMDSEMFLEELIWDINIEMGNLGLERNNNLFSNTKNEKEIDFLNYIKESENETYYEINDLFYVYFIHKKKCVKCGYQTYYFDESPGLKLNFEHTKYQSNIDLVQLILDNFQNDIKIKSRILCQNCNICFEVNEETRIAKLPKILILSLQKGNKDNTQKIPWVVDFKENIGIRQIVDIELAKNESARYKIFAINNHLGSTPKSGHYYSQIYLEQLKSWYSFNDEYVNKDSDWNRPKLSNYILFYKQINN